MTYRSPATAVDIIIRLIDRPHQPLVLIERRNSPYGWALPGGFVDYGESLEEAARREAREETGLDILLISLFHAYSNPKRDSRQHTISIVFFGRGSGHSSSQ
jgi:8-oxo-dGTP diphosphatase